MRLKIESKKKATAFGRWYDRNAKMRLRRGLQNELARRSGLSFVTIWRVRHGLVKMTFEAAERLSAATGGEVAIRDLCEAK